MLTVATLLAWDAARTRLGHFPDFGAPARPVTARAATGGTASRRRVTMRQFAGGLSWFAAGQVYAGAVSSFKRHFWPATIAVVALGCMAVAVGWQDPLRRRAALTGRAPAPGLGLGRCAGGRRALGAELAAPAAAADNSYAHPTIIAMTDPLLASHPGRTVALGAWLLIGYFLAER